MTDDETLQEAAQADALQELAAALNRYRQAETDVRAAALKARNTGVSIARMATVMRMTRDRVYGWLKSAETSKAAKKTDTHPRAKPSHG